MPSFIPSFLKRKPKDYSADHPDIELLKYKSFLAVHNLTEADATADGFLSRCEHVFEALKPFDDFLNTALEKVK